MLESGEFATIAELAESEGIAPSYMTRVLRLTQLEPAIIEAILDGKQAPNVTLGSVMQPFPHIWTAQMDEFSGQNSGAHRHATATEPQNLCL